MREIKFRGKRIDNGRWVYGQYFKTPLTDENSGTLPEAGWFFLTGETRHCIVQDGVSFVIDVNTLGQYVNLKDKNGIPIFEGDIVKVSEEYGGHSYSPLVVDFKDCCFILRRIDYMSDYNPMFKYDFTQVYEVIGNICDNSDLLKSE